MATSSFPAPPLPRPEELAARLIPDGSTLTAVTDAENGDAFVATLRSQAAEAIAARDAVIVNACATAVESSSLHQVRGAAVTRALKELAGTVRGVLFSWRMAWKQGG